MGPGMENQMKMSRKLCIHGGWGGGGHVRNMYWFKVLATASCCVESGRGAGLKEGLPRSTEKIEVH